MNEYWNDSPYMLWREANSIMHITYKKNLVIDIETARKIVNERLSFFQGRSYPVLLDGRHTKLVTREALEYFSKEDGMKGVKALALLPGNYVTMVMAKIFLQFTKYKVPVKIFMTRENAEKWLMKFAVADVDLQKE